MSIFEARDDLKKKVEQMIAIGWRPEGAATHTGNYPPRGEMSYHRFTQTMVKDDEAEAKWTDMAKLTDMVKLENEILAAAKVNHDEAMTRMTEQIEAMIRHAKAND